MKPLYFLLVIIISLSILSCQESVPKPNGYFRIDLPEKKTVLFQPQVLPYSFGISNISQMKYDTTGRDISWLIIEYPRYRARILCSYQPISPQKFRAVSEQNRDFVYRHTVRATAINQKLFQHPQRKVYGIFYELKGSAATPCQFMLTDSVKNFFRGSLYFDCVPQPDSLAPVVDYIKADILDLMQTFEWR